MKSVISAAAVGQASACVTIEVGEGESRRWLVLGVTHTSITTAAHDGAPVEGAVPEHRSARPSPACWRNCSVPRAMPMRAKAWSLAGLDGTMRCRSAAALAQGAGPGLPLLIGQGPAGTSYSVPVQTLLFFTALSFLPAVLLMMTGFTRIVIVLSLLRQALGTQAAPPNQVVVGLSLFLTFFVMGPTLDKVYEHAWQPYSAGRIDFDQALEQAQLPMRGFMLKQTRQADWPVRAPGQARPESAQTAEVPFKVLVPAFVTSELKTAFQIGFMIFIPFLVIDMIVASVLMSLGMMMLSPVLVALPFKLMLFVLADGWNLLIGSWRLPSPFSETHGRPTGLHPRTAGALDAADGGRPHPHRRAGGRRAHQRAAGGHADQRGHAVLRAEDPAAVATLALAGPWMITQLVEYIQRTLQAIPGAVG
jgi:flagellar biosynthetic protein FliP